MVADVGDCLQRDNGAVETGLAGGVADGEAETVAVFDLPHGWTAGESRAANGVAPGDKGGAVNGVDRGHEAVADSSINGECGSLIDGF